MYTKSKTWIKTAAYFFLVISCTKEIDVIESFTFSVDAESTTALVNQEVPINFQIVRLGSETISYDMTYSSDIEGTFNYDGNIYTPGQTISVPVGDFKGSFIGTTAGEANLKFVVTDSNSLELEESIDINFSIIDYNFTVNPSDNDIIQEEEIDVLFNLSEIEEEGSSNYEIRYTIVEGSGISISNSDGPTSAATWYSVSTGNFSWKLLCTVPGSVNILFESRNTTGILKSASIAVTVNEGNNFSLKDGGLLVLKYIVNEENVMGTIITPLTETTSEYQFRYEIISGSVSNVKKGNTLISEGQYYTVTDFTPFGEIIAQIRFTPTTLDDVTIRFYVKNDFGLEKQIDLTRPVVFRLTQFQIYYHISNLTNSGSTCNGSFGTEQKFNYTMNIIAGGLVHSSPNTIKTIVIVDGGVSYTFDWNPTSISWTNRDKAEGSNALIPNSGIAKNVIAIHSETITNQSLGSTGCNGKLQFELYRDLVFGTQWQWTSVSETFGVRVIDQQGNESNQISVSNRIGNIFVGFVDRIPYAPF